MGNSSYHTIGVDHNHEPLLAAGENPSDRREVLGLEAVSTRTFVSSF